MKKIYCLNAVNFLAAFLLFQIELVISKALLPKFGGSYLVWGACMVFFQFTLLLGYFFSHIVIQKFGIFRYRYFHLALLFLPLFFFPGRPLLEIHSHYGFPLVIDVFGQLLLAIGLVFFVLSTTSIISQSWLAASALPGRTNPYTLYSMSNLGSALGLLTYPFLFEAFFDLGVQLNIWRIGYLVLLGLHLMMLKTIGVSQSPINTQSQRYNIPEKEKIRWFLLGVSGTTMFLSVTNIITYEVAPVPLFWIIPLCIYLASFVLNFKERPFCPAWIKENFHITIGLNIFFFWLTQKGILPFAFEIIIYLSSLFIFCMFAQNELVRTRPQENSGLTLFYLIISMGSVMGGILVTWVVPLISSVVSAVMVEYLLGLLIISLAKIIGEKKPPLRPYYLRLIFYTVIMLILWPMAFKRYNVFGLAAILLFFKFIYSELKYSPRAFFISVFFIVLLSPFLQSLWQPQKSIYSYRNYYGMYKVCVGDNTVFLLNGTILHGAQSLNPKTEMEPLAYFHNSTPVGKIMSSKNFNFQRIGIIGLGAGTLAAYGRPGQVIDFFELDPDVLRIADMSFTYLKNSKARINYLFGDARISLTKIQRGPYDILIVDAFSGDSVPIHLLTTEAIAEYKRHITKDGIILLHITNRYLDLVPVLFSNARAQNAYAEFSYNEASPGVVAASVWVALTWSKDTLNLLSSGLQWPITSSKDRIKYIRPWTDKYSHIFSIFKFKRLTDSIKEFQPFSW